MSSPTPTNFLTSGATGILLPQQVTDLVVLPLQQTSVFAQVSQWVSADSPFFRFPILSTLPTCNWTAEGQQLNESVPGIAELVAQPQKLTCLVPISRELAHDSNPAAASVVGDSVVLAAARALDVAAFGSNADVPNSPAGLADLQGVQTLAAGTYANMDWAVEAENLLNQVGSSASAYVMSANTLQALAKLKRFEATATVVSNEPILTPGSYGSPRDRGPADSLPRQVAKYQINGTDALWVPNGVLEDGVIYAIHDRFSYVVVREDYELVVSPWPMFNYDMVVLRFVFRATFAWPKPESVVRITGTLPA